MPPDIVVVDESSSEARQSDNQGTRGRKRKRKRRVPHKKIPTGKGSLDVAVHKLNKRKKKDRVHKCSFCNSVKNTYADKKDCEASHGSKFVCTKYPPCSRSFGSSVGLQQHEMAHRTAVEDMHKCEFCPKRFLFKSGLKKHLKTHSDTKPYGCYIKKCNKRYKSKSDCARHVKEHLELLDKESNPQKEFEMFRCKEEGCSYEGDTKKKLQDHMIKHTGVECNFCHKLFYHRNTLKRHRDGAHYARRNTWYLWLPDNYKSFFFPCEDLAYPRNLSGSQSVYIYKRFM